MQSEDRPMTSSRPYLVRAIYEWILDNQMTPHLLVDAAYPGTRVPVEFVENGQIVLNLAPSAVQGLLMGNDWVEFNARFGGVARRVEIPSEAVLGIFSRENHQGLIFPPEERADTEAPTDSGADTTVRDRPVSAPTLRVAPAATGEGPKPPKGKGRGGPTLKVVK